MRDSRGDEPEGNLSIEWSSIYRREWDESPGEYVAAGLVARGRSRRLAKLHDPERGFSSYLGVQHFEPARYHLSGPATTKFFASFLVRECSADLRTFASLRDALIAVRAFHARLTERDGVTKDGARGDGASGDGARTPAGKDEG